VVAAEPITDIDTTAADMLEDLDVKLNAKNVNLIFAEMKSPVQARVERYELTGTINPEHFFPTISEAVRAYQRQTGAEWSTGPGEPHPPA
jgi:MFS superfamily sulfate permease-like transporter